MDLGPDLRIVRELGRGGVGVVYEARDVAGGAFAVKVLLEAHRGEALARFERERRLQAQLGESAGFVPVLRCGEGPAGPYVVMPLLAGGTLRRRLARGPLQVDEAVALGVALGEALGRSHAQGIVHRDLKPENVLFTAEGRPLIGDLGMAKHFRHDTPGASRSVALSRSREQRGTAGYCAPEQIVDAARAGPPSDVFALGAIIYECLTGRPAFGGEDVLQRLVNLSKATVEPVTRLRPEVPRAVADAVERALAAEPAERHADGAAFAAALGATRARPRGRARPALVALPLLAALGVGAALATRGRPRDASPGPSGEIASAPAPTVSATWAPPSSALVTLHSREGARLVAALGTDTAWSLTSTPTGVAWLASETELLVGTQVGRFHRLAVADGRSLHEFADPGLPPGKGRTTGALASVVDAESGATYVLAAATEVDEQVMVERGTRPGELARGRGLTQLFAPAFPFFQYVESQDGPVVAVGTTRDRRGLAVSRGGTLQVFPLPSVALPAPPRTRRVLDGEVLAAAVAGDGSVVAAVGPGHRVRWTSTGEADDDALGLGLDLGGPARALALSEDGRTLAVGLEDGRVELLVRSAGLVEVARGEAPVTALALSPDGERVVAGFADGTAVLARRDEPSRPLPGHLQSVDVASFSPSGRLVLTGGRDYLVRVHDGTTGAPLNHPAPGHRGQVRHLATASDGALVLSASFDGTIGVWDARAARLAGRLVGHGNVVPTVACTPDGRRAVSGSFDRTVRVWDVPRRAEVLRLAGHTDAVHGVDVAPDGLLAVSASYDGALRVWDLPAGVCTWTWEHPQRRADPARARLHAVALLPGAARALVTGADGEVRVLDLTRREETARFAVQRRACWFVVPTRDGRRLLVASDEGLRVWDLEARAVVVRCPVNAKGVLNSAAFTADERVIASASLDGVLRLHDARTGELLEELPLGAACTAAAAGPGPRTIFGGTQLGLILGFEVAPGE